MGSGPITGNLPAERPFEYKKYRRLPLDWKPVWAVFRYDVDKGAEECDGTDLFKDDYTYIKVDENGVFVSSSHEYSHCEKFQLTRYGDYILFGKYGSKMECLRRTAKMLNCAQTVERDEARKEALRANMDIVAGLLNGSIGPLMELSARHCLQIMGQEICINTIRVEMRNNTPMAEQPKKATARKSGKRSSGNLNPIKFPHENAAFDSVLD